MPGVYRIKTNDLDLNRVKKLNIEIKREIKEDRDLSLSYLRELKTISDDAEASDRVRMHARGLVVDLIKNLQNNRNKQFKALEILIKAEQNISSDSRNTASELSFEDLDSMS